MRTLTISTLLLFTQFAAALPIADYHYDGTLKIDPQSGYIAADWRITVLDQTQSTVTFYIRNTLGGIDVSGAAVRDVAFEHAEGLAAFRVIRIDLVPGEGQRVIQLRYAGVLLPEPLDNRINAIEPERVELNVDSFWHPIDSGFDKQLTADLLVQIGAGWTGVTTGEARHVDNGVRLINTEPQIDIAFTLARSFKVHDADGFTIYDQRTDPAGTDRLLEATRHCVNYLNSRFGKTDPLRRGKLLITERSSSGYARRNYVVFTDVAETEPGPLTRFVCHEFSHYWNSGAAFDTVENWLNEAFAEYVGLMATRERLGQTSYATMLASFREQIKDQQLPPVWQAGDTQRGPYLVQYRKGPLILARLEEEMGAEAFLRFVQAWLAQTDRTTPTLLSILERTSSPAQRARFEGWLGDRE